MLRMRKAKALTLGAALLGMSALVGCEDSPVKPESTTDQTKAQNKAMADAMQKAHAPGGVANSGKPTAAPKPASTPKPEAK